MLPPFYQQSFIGMIVLPSIIPLKDREHAHPKFWCFGFWILGLVCVLGGHLLGSQCL